VALKHGQRASFMSKPYLQAPGSGMHVHVSLYDAAGNNLLAADEQRPLRHAVAGCLELLPHCMPIFAANHNAYRRYGAMVNAASRASWGYEDRDACIRIPESDGRNLRIEHRLAGADANPYLVLAAILTGMEHGLDAQREPIAPLNDNRQSGIDFPQDMLGAVAAMRDHPVVNQGLGSEFVMVYCENKRQDHLAFMHDLSAREYRWFL
jgi:glutamine synthetase